MWILRVKIFDANNIMFSPTYLPIYPFILIFSRYVQVKGLYVVDTLVYSLGVLYILDFFFL